jgi:hypothetical protein
MIIFLIIALIIAIFIIWGLATHNNNVDEQVEQRLKSEKERLQAEYTNLYNNSVSKYKNQCDNTLQVYKQKYEDAKQQCKEKYDNLTRECQQKYEDAEQQCKEKYDNLTRECQQKYEDAEQQCKRTYIKYESSLVLLQQKQQEADQLHETYLQELSKIDQIVAKKFDLYPHLAAVMADLLTVHYDRSAQFLKEKSRPAYTEAFRINELKKETKKIIEEKKLLEYQIAYIRKVIPNIDDIFDNGFIDNEIPFEAETQDNTDRVRFYLEPEEYQKLSSVERNQLALDRYIAGRKSKWQIGRDYEMYIGYLYEKKGCAVEYMGIIKGLEDLGRDLIVKKNGKTSIIQCKNWSKEKTIHEKHIFQLFGTVVLYNIEHPQANAKGIFISTTALSETALQVAKELDIQVVQKDHGEFPRIKCNINRSTGEWIYHLPFDQQYDSARIDKKQGEFYALTVAEAENAGFRRAFKHFA